MYTLGPGGSLQVTRDDVASLHGEKHLRYGFVDVLARYMWQELTPVADREDAHVGRSVFYFLLCRVGP